MASSSVQVAVRLRPINEQEKKHGTLPVVTASTAEKSVTVIKGKGSRQIRSQFSFDNVFTSFSTQEEVFEETLKPVISDVFKGYESTVFAYGQTGTGKTHTMEGDLSNPDNHGVIPRSAKAIFDNLRSPQYSSHTVTCSYLEIYNEELGDLLSDGNNKVTMMEGKNGVVCRGLSEESVNSASDVLSLMNRAQHKRHIGETNMNKQSSRSHCIFTVRVSAAVKVDDGTVTLEGKLHMVDLAGSECAKTANMDKTTGNEAARERERMSINRSLLTLGRVISVLKEQSQNKKSNKNVRIPYRDSKLTRILQESLGGRCKTVIIATLSPSITAIEESISTLNYAQSANGIINKPVSTSKMCAGASSSLLSGTSTPSKKGITTESWNEMECRLQYMQTQVEEAQAALGRKHMQQQELVERAEKAKKDVSDREVRIGLMEKEINTLRSNLSNEVEKRRSAEAKMRKAQYSLQKTTAILVATQQTEASLTSEATSLLRALKEAVADGDLLHKTIVGCKEVENERQTATKNFREAAISVLEDSADSLGILAREVDAHAETLMNSAARGYEQENTALAATQSLVKEISDNVKWVTNTVSKQLLDEEGIIPLLRDLTSSVDAKSTAAAEAISGGESALEASCISVRQKLVEHAKHLKELEAVYANASSGSITALESNVADNKAKIKGMVESASRSLQDGQNVRAERMKELSELISDWREASLDTSSNIDAAATSQSSAISELVAFMETEMVRHNTTGTILTEQKAFIDASEGTQMESLSSQSSLLSSQQSMIAKARKEQEEMRADIMKTIMGGVQELVNQQMQRLADADGEHTDGMIGSNRSVIESNASIAKATKDMNEKLRAANSALSVESQKIRENDINAKKVMEGTSKVLDDISEMASKNVSATTTYSKKVSENINQVQKCDKKSEQVLEGIKADGGKCAMHMEKTIQHQTKQDVMRLASTFEQTTNYASNNVIPDASAAMDAVEESRKGHMKLFNKEICEMVESTGLGAKKIEDVSKKQVAAAKNLCANVEEKEQHFSDQIAAKQQASMSSRKEELVKMAKLHSTASKEKISSAEAQSRGVVQRIGTFAAFADEEVLPAPDRKVHAYSTSLSATPAEDSILQKANIQMPEVPHSDDDDASMKSEEKANDDNDDESSSQISQDVSQSTQDTMDASMESDAAGTLSPPHGLKEIAVNKKQSAIPVPKVKRPSSSSRSRAASPAMKRPNSSSSRSRTESPAVSRKRAKTARHGHGRRK